MKLNIARQHMQVYANGKSVELKLSQNPNKKTHTNLSVFSDYVLEQLTMKKLVWHSCKTREVEQGGLLNIAPQGQGDY